MQHGYAKLARGPDDFQACDSVAAMSGLARDEARRMAVNFASRQKRQ